jgi:glutathione S-transferase
MPAYTLVIGNKNYSSWSMRPWLALKATGKAFKEVVIVLDQKNSKQEILKYSPSGSVPVLLIDNTPIWDSLSICEALAELHPEANLWPTDREAKAHARSICAEMHSSFLDLRKQCPMDMKKRAPVTPSPEVKAQLTRIEQIWENARAKYGKGGNFLFGHFTIADAFYAPVVSRFITYGFPASKENQKYMDTISSMPHFKEWYNAALEEKMAA